ncbi:MAG: hypothetical protein ACFFBI_12370 [Promethearchaeota archaeon]
MTEIKKITKISLLVLCVLNFIFGILTLFLYDLFVAPLTGWTNPLHPRVLGGVMFIISIFAIILIRKKEWEEIKLTYTLIYSLLLPTILVELVIMATMGSTFSAALLSQMFLDQILMWIMFVLGIFSYYKQRG